MSRNSLQHDRFPIVSIVVPIYNGGGYIYSLIQNIQKVNDDFFCDIEVLLVDDGSNDNSSEICQQICSEYENVAYYYKTNGGIASARNYGLERARGKYLMFSDQDDKYLSGLKDYVTLMGKNQAQVLIADRTFSNRGEIKKENKILYDELCYKDKIDTVLRQLIGGKNILRIKTNLNQPTNDIPFAVWTCIFNRQFVISHRIVFKAIVDYEDDWRFTTECLLNADVLQLVSKSFYAWEINLMSESHKRKYINCFFQRRTDAIEWNIIALEKMGVDKSEIRKQRLLENKRTIIWGFFNSGILGRELCCQETKEIASKAGCSLNLLRYSEGIADRLFIILFWLNLYSLAYTINEKFLHRRYH